MREIRQVFALLEELRQDGEVPKSVKSKLTEIKEQLENADELSLSINKILSELEDVMNDANIDPVVRTQLFNLATLLEGLVA